MLDYRFEKFTDMFNKNNFSDFVLGVDLGGTSTNICIAGIRDSKPYILFIYYFETKRLDSLSSAINQVLSHAKEKFDLDESKFDYFKDIIIKQSINKNARLDFKHAAKKLK